MKKFKGRKRHKVEEEYGYVLKKFNNELERLIPAMRFIYEYRYLGKEHIIDPAFKKLVEEKVFTENKKDFDRAFELCFGSADIKETSFPEKEHTGGAINWDMDV